MKKMTETDQQAQIRIWVGCALVSSCAVGLLFAFPQAAVYVRGVLAGIATFSALVTIVLGIGLCLWAAATDIMETIEEN